MALCLAVYEIKWNGQTRLRHNYDSLGRVISNSFRTSSGNTAYDLIEYTDVGEDRTSTLVSEYINNDTIYTYSYDKVGNIVDIKNLYSPSSYEYDELNQLVRENNKSIGKTYTYSYSNGNITERKEYAYTTGELGEVVDTKVWTYGDSTWRDLLTDFNGTAITYDEIGNPLTMGGKTLTWDCRTLQSITDGENTYSYRYNGDGQRVSKTVNGVKTDYYYNGSILAGQKTGNEVLSFMYDENGVYFGFIYNGEDYYFIKNLQNDVEAISDKDENIVVSYTYDAWGNVNEISGSQANTLGKLNPIRYRGYYYDSETNLYYLRSRYYSPEMCRFINADYVLNTYYLFGYNLFTYCFNNPVQLVDPDGDCPYNGTAADFHRLEQGLPSLDCVCNNSRIVSFSKSQNERPDTGLRNLTDEEIQKRARDKSLSGKERKKYQKEEKIRGLRNKKKRQSDFSLEPMNNLILGVSLVTVSAVGIVIVISNDITGIGIADDFLLPSFSTTLGEGVLLIFA